MQYIKFNNSWKKLVKWFNLYMIQNVNDFKFQFEYCENLLLI